MWDGPSSEELMSYDEQDRLAEEQEQERELEEDADH